MRKRVIVSEGPANEEQPARGSRAKSEVAGLENLTRNRGHFAAEALRSSGKNPKAQIALEAHLDIRFLLQMNGIDKADGAGFKRHDQRVDASAFAKKADAAHQCAIGHA